MGADHDLENNSLGDFDSLNTSTNQYHHLTFPVPEISTSTPTLYSQWPDTHSYLIGHNETTCLNKRPIHHIQQSQQQQSVSPNPPFPPHHPLFHTSKNHHQKKASQPVWDTQIQILQLS